MAKQIHSEDTLIDIYKLSGYDMDRIILNEGQIGVSLVEDCIYIYLPSLNEYIHYPTHLHARFSAKLQPDLYRLSLSEAVLKIDSATESPMSLLITANLLPLLDRYMDINDDTTLLISSRRDLPVFVGNSKIIKRLADDFDSLDGIMPVKQFEIWKEAHVRS